MLYAVTSKENNQVSVFVQAYQDSTDRAWQCIDVYSTGSGYVENALDLPCIAERDWTVPITKNVPDLGELLSTHFEYTGFFSPEEKESIEWQWELSRTISSYKLAVLYAADWKISVPKMIVSGPFNVERMAA